MVVRLGHRFVLDLPSNSLRITGLRWLPVICLLLTWGWPQPAEARELRGYALINDDASLQVQGKTVHLFGIYIPDTGRKCRSNIRPVQCASRAALALDFKIQGFVNCFVQEKNRDRSVNAVCYLGRSSFSDGLDLATYLIEHGWALALPDAPFEYHASEKIARHNNRGVWGFSVDSIQNRR
jgi:endonuclease YncB( thermonuclease family)